MNIRRLKTEDSKFVYFAGWKRPGFRLKGQALRRVQASVYNAMPVEVLKRSLTYERVYEEERITLTDLSVYYDGIKYNDNRRPDTTVLSDEKD
jgi:hypothetical protein